MKIEKIGKDNSSFKIGEDGTIISLSKDPNSMNKKYWIWSVISLIVIITVIIIWSLRSKDINDIFLLGLKGNIESINEISDYYVIDGCIEQKIPESDQGLFDGNAFLSLIFGDEHCARMPFNYLMLYSTNATFQFNNEGNIETLVSNTEEGGFISFYYDKENNLIRQDAFNNIHRNQDEGIIQYSGNQIVNGSYKGYTRKVSSSGDIVLSNGTKCYATISFDENKRMKRMYLPNYWRDTYAEYLFEYNNKGWLIKVLSRTGYKGRGQIITTFSYKEIDEKGNWTKRIADIDYRIYEERVQYKVVTLRKILYKTK